MGKIVKAVIIIVIAVAIIYFAPYLAPALTHALAAVGVAATVSASTIIGLGLSLAISAAASLLVKTPKLNNSLADRLNINSATDAPRRIVFGSTLAGQDNRFKEVFGNKSDKVALVFALASHKVSAIKSVKLGTEVSWTPSGVTGKYASGIIDLTPTALGSSANSRMVGTGVYWNTSATMTGCAYLTCTLDASKSSVFPEGLPNQFLTEVDGCPVYDPRRDGSRIGTGPHRWDNQATWAFDDGAVQLGRNAALCLLSYLIGWRINGRLIWGMGIPIDAIDLANFALYANLCEERVAITGGGTTQRYTCDMICSTADTHESIIDNIVSCMGAAKFLDLGGMYQLSGGYDDTLGPTLAFGEDDIIKGQCIWKPSANTRSSFNRISGKFADPTDNYTLKSWGEIEIDPLADGIPRSFVVDFPGISRSETAQRVAKQFLLRQKYSGEFTGLFMPRAFAAPVGSLVTLTLAEFGFTSKLFRVTARSEAADLIFQISLREESPEIWAWSNDEAKAVPSNIITTDYDPVETETPTGLSLSARSITGSNSLVSAFCDLTWTAPASNRILSIKVQSRIAGDTQWSAAMTARPDSRPMTFSAAANGKGIEVRAAYVMDNGVSSPWATTSISSTHVTNVNSWPDLFGTGKPENGADVTSTHTSNDTSHVAGVASSTVITNISDLVTTYGSTASAAASASAASTSASAADAAKIAAQSAQTTASGSASSASGSASAAASSASIATTKASDASTSASAADAAKVAAQGYSSTASTQASAASSSASSASGSAAAALSSANLSASLATASLLKNPVFSIWTNASAQPDQWDIWDSHYVITRQTGSISPYMLEIAGPTSGTNAGLVATPAANAGLTNIREGWFVIEADVEFVSGSWIGAGVLLFGLNSSGSVVDSQYLNFSVDNDTSGQLATTTGNRVFRWRKLVKLTGSTIQNGQLYLMNGWDAFSASSTNKTLRWHKLGIRVASSSEIEARQAATDSTAALSQISTESGVRAADDLALSNRSTALESTVNNATTGVAATYAKVSTEESTRASADNALATRATNLESTVNHSTTGVAATYAKVSTEETTRASADGALATRATNLESTVNDGTTGVAAAHSRITSEASTRSSADGALSNRADTLEAQFAGTTGSAIKSSITSEASTRASETGALATRSTNLESTVNNGTTGVAATVARVTTAEGAITSLNGKTTAYWTTTAVAGSGRAELAIHADANGGGGVDITGDVSISGSLLVGGTITTGKIASNAVTIPDTVSANDYVWGPTYETDILTSTVYMDEPGRLLAVATVAQTFPSGDRSWQMILYINDNPVFGVGGAKTADSVSLTGSLDVDAGYSTIRLTRSGNTGAAAVGRVLVVQGAKR